MRNSIIRKRILQLLYYIGYSHPYEIYKIYKSLYGEVCLRNIYYHIKKAIEEGDIKIWKVESVSGDFTWGDKAKRIYLLPNINKKIDPLPNELIKKVCKFRKSISNEEKAKIIENFKNDEKALKWLDDLEQTPSFPMESPQRQD